MNQAQVDFQQLRIKHILFKSKVRSVLYGGTYDADFFSDNGPVNLWFNSIGLVRYKTQQAMQDLLQVQKELNATTNQLFSRYKSGKIEEAHQGLGKVDELSEKFLKLLTKLEGTVEA